MKRLLFDLSIIVVACLCAGARTIVFENISQTPITGVRCVGLSQAMDSVALFVTDSRGTFLRTEIFVRDRANMLSLKLSYNFKLGRNRNKAIPQYDNFSNDSGILAK